VIDCESVRRLIPALLDDELVGDERRPVEDHLQRCASCRAAFENESALSAAIREALPREVAAPKDLEDRVAGLPLETKPRPGRSAWQLVGVAAALLAAVGWATLKDWGGPRSINPGLASLAVDSHLRYASGRLPLEFRSDRPQHVSRWFAGRVPFNVTLPDYPVGPGERKFYTLEGGRLVSLEGDYVAYVAYRMEGRPISLLVASAERVHPSGRTVVPSGGLDFHIDSRAGLEVITWTDKGLTYALASDVSVGGAKSRLVCHGSPSERRKIEGLSPTT
jgi:anti-sigma factor RsiW